jgi:hypothetical protein
MNFKLSTKSLLSGGTNETGHTYDKYFWFPTHFKATWVQANFICKSYGLKMISLDSFDEMRAFMKEFLSKIKLFNEAVYMGAILAEPRSKTEWYWVATGKKLNFDLPWYPGEPNNYGGSEQCLLLHTLSLFLDLKCYEERYFNFLCQSVEFT